MKPDRELFFINGMFINHIAVILACHEDAFRFTVDDRMICTPVSEWQLECIPSERERDQLMAETDAESRITADDAFDLS